MPAKQIPLIVTIGQIASILMAAEVGYYIVLPGFGFPTSYYNNPVGIASYYGFWIIVSLMTFWHAFEGWKPIKNRVSAYAFLFVSFAGFILLTLYILPQKDIWYFFPKSIDILLQQLLIAALVRAFAAQNFGMREITAWCVFLFGGAHLTLAFWGLPAVYIIQFTISAMAFALIFPHLILKVPNGFVYSYTLHWIYYAAIIMMGYQISPYVV